VQHVDERLAVAAEVGEQERTEERQRRVLRVGLDRVVEDPHRILRPARVPQRARELQHAAGHELVRQAERERAFVVRDRLLCATGRVVLAPELVVAHPVHRLLE